MQFDPDNTVVKLCSEGMNAEFEGDMEKAHHIFQQAWDAASSDFESFTAAHYLARNQKNPKDTLHWNLKALDHALAISSDDMKVHFPSLYLNIAKSYETLGQMSEAAKYYLSAADIADQLPDSGYGRMIRAGIHEGLKRTGPPISSNEKLLMLIDRWCERKDLKPLSMILPTWVGNLGSEKDLGKLLSALYYLSATKSLPENDQKILEEIIDELTIKTEQQSG